MEKNLEILYELPKCFCARIQIERSMKTAKLYLLRSIFDDFKEEMKGIESKNGLELEKDVLYYSYEDKDHQKFYDSYSSTYPGLNYVVKKENFKKAACRCGLG